MRKAFLLLLLAVGAQTLSAQYAPYPPYPPNPRPRVAVVSQATIRTDVHPKDAQIYIDGGLVGTVKDYNGSHERLLVPAGIHTIEFRASGYVTYADRLNLQPGQDIRLRARMEKIPHR